MALTAVSRPPWAVTMMTMISSSNSLTFSSTSRPEMPGICISRRTSSGCSSRTSFRASSPLPAVRTSYPCFIRFCSRDQRIRCSSSTTIIFAFLIGAPLYLNGRVRHPRRGRSRLNGAGLKLNGKDRPLAVFAVDGQDPAVLGDEFVTDGEAETGALGLGGKERREDFPQDLRRDAGAGIGNADPDPLLPLFFQRSAGDGEYAPLPHCLERIQDQIEKHLLDLFGVHIDGGEIFIEFQPFFHVLPSPVLGGEHESFLQDGVHVDAGRLGLGRFAEKEQVIDRFVEPLDLFKDFVDDFRAGIGRRTIL